MDAVVLAGGMGTRLRGVVGDRLKPFADVGGRPFVEWLLVGLRDAGFRRIILATGYRGEWAEACLGDGSRLGVELVFSREEVPLGTGGGARHALRHAASDRVLVLNGDSYCPCALDRLSEAHRNFRARATLWLVPMADARRYGSVELDPDGRVLSFREKSPAPQGGLVHAGICLFERAVLEAIPSGRAVSLEKDVFPGLAGRGLHGAVGAGPLVDIGTPESYAEAVRLFSAGVPRFSGTRSPRGAQR